MADFIDEATVHCIAGKGGNGCVSFRREKYIPYGGPNGGDGGHGGSVIFRASSDLSSLVNVYRSKRLKADSGTHGMGSQKTGKSGSDLVVEVPTGTCLFDADYPESPMIIDLVSDQQEYIIAKGGQGGLGNMRFKSSTNRAPRKATDGEEGQEIRVRLELKVMADVGLLGLPNAGKSSLLRRVSAATPKVADYAFTTIRPYVGVVRFDQYNTFVMADVPGLIEGASQGSGMGDQFLKHLQRCKMLLHIVDGSQDVVTQIETIRKEVKSYGGGVDKKKIWIVINKIDLIDDIEVLRSLVLDQYGVYPIMISAKDGLGCSELVASLGDELVSRT
ncbi:GTPase ObgE [Candidatus Comchoanobacter bicostacola]|uniref:GTPase Obg n=1 Tax=Candidatus Comchoanobacter bicostacola TaxID=2919598 RepID=A0ABY5DKP3_9GAMM|nr:GTPase ObgE [Candidatus Comchoanobacter bicostacola]UTC24382.1 GTPase ObgE [Candidatus Comchoanobacter bicostacola]